MATLVSPGVDVTVTDQAFTVSSGPGTVPLVVIATGQDKASGSGTGIASGTTAANAGKLYLITSQRDAIATFGTPTFYSVAGTPQHGNELNEYGLSSLYQYLGIANRAYVIRGDLDLTQLVPSTTEPTGEPAANTYWLDSANSTWGLFRSSGNVNPALSWAAKSPTVISSMDQLEAVCQGDSATQITSASASLLSVSGNLVINGNSVGLAMNDSLADVASKINSAGLDEITAVIFEREEKTGASSYGDVFNLRLVSSDSSVSFDFTGSNSTILTDLGLTGADTWVVPLATLGSAGSYAIDAYSNNNVKVWEKIAVTTVSGTQNWWFATGTTDSDMSGWGWTEAAPTTVTGSVANPTVVAGATTATTVNPGSAGDYAPGDILTVSGGTSTSSAEITVKTATLIGVTIAAPGGGYSGGDEIYVFDDNYAVGITLTVTTTGGGGTLTGVNITDGGILTGTVPTDPVGQTGTNGGGSAATFNFEWGVLDVDVTNGGDYTVLPSNPVAVTGGSGGTGATFDLDWASVSVRIGSGSDITVESTGSGLTNLVSDINAAISATNAIASEYTVGSNTYLRIRNYDGTSVRLDDVSMTSGSPSLFADCGMTVAQNYYNTVTGTVLNPTFTGSRLKTVSATVVDTGVSNDYAVGDILTVVGGTSYISTELYVRTVLVRSVSVNNPGSGYLAGQTVTFSGAGYNTPVVLSITSVGGGGVITGATVLVAGDYDGVLPTNPVSPTTTSGSGINADFDLTWGVSTVSVFREGDYTVFPSNPVTTSTSSAGVGATFNLTSDVLEANSFKINPGSGGVTVYVPAAPDNTLDGVVSAINASFSGGEIVASNNAGYLKITSGNASGFTLEDIRGTSLLDAGIPVGFSYGRSVTHYGYSPNLTYPSDIDALVSGSLWINTTQANRGANIVIKKYSASTSSWVTQNVPMYSNDVYANAGYGANKVVGSLYARYNADGATPEQGLFAFYRWDSSAWVPLTYTPGSAAPTGEPAAGTYWYNTDLRVDIMVGNGQDWKGYRNIYAQTDPNGAILSGSQPDNQSDGTPLVDNDIWIDTSDLENYPKIYRYTASDASWTLVDNTDQSSPAGIVFGDARPNNDGTQGGSEAISAMLVSDYVDSDAPSALAYPAGFLLFNTRYSTYNVKTWTPDALTTGTYRDRWVTASGNQTNGSPYMGRKAQRILVVRSLAGAITANQDIRAENVFFNIISVPGYPELIDEMITLNVDKKETAFIIADTPARLSPDGISITNWANNTANASGNGEDALVSSSPYVGVYYPWGLSTNLDGTEIMVPPSAMVLRTIAFNDQVAYPWFAPAGFNRGLVSGVASVGYLTAENEYQPVILNQGQRDTLYVNKINPIAYLPGRGLVVYGQKTLNPVESALDRVNVARLTNYLRYQLDNLAKPFLFEQNDQITRDSVQSSFERFLADLISLRALDDFAVVCDETNNTPVRIDRNELWIDVAIIPLKAIEFIYIPVRILNTGAQLG